MLSWINEIWMVLAGLGSLLAVIFAQRSRSNAARADRAEEQRDAAHRTIQRQNTIQQELGKTEQRHREEQIHETQRLDSGHRDHLDNNW